MKASKKSIGIIGNGAIAYMIALELFKSCDDEHISLIGKDSKNGASRCAGAMLNILSEVDFYNSESALINWKLSNRKKVLQYWENVEEYLNDFRDNDYPLIHGKGTTMKLEKGSMNIFEKKSFNAIKNLAEINSIQIELKDDDKFYYLDIPDERSVDPNLLIKSCYKKIKSNVDIINSNVTRIKREKNMWILETEYNVYSFEKIIIAAGTWSDRLIRNSRDITNPTIKGFNDVGSALLLSSEFPHVDEPKINRILRTPNRGGSCGIHSVQRNDCIYIGASSHLTHVDMQLPKASSLNALISGIDSIVGIKSHMLSAESVTGYRPVTEDSYPIIGNLEENLWCIYGTKRDGFTWSPYYAKEIVNMILKRKSDNKKDWDQMLMMCSPMRELNSFGEPQFCIEAFIESKKAEAYQHNIKLKSEEILELKNIAEEAHLKIQKRLGKPIGLNPDLIKILNFFN